MAYANANYSDVLATTIESRSGIVADNVTKNNALLTRLREKGKMKPFSGGSTILQEEIFGPIAPITRFKTEEEAVRLANDTEYGLVSYAFTADLKRGLRLIETLDTGMTGLNTGLVSNAAAPFGGVKASGLGREGGPEGINEYLETKYVMTPDPLG
jgi:succinate-semialdehyde dehydrogenase/glutarate-semialdehyde dehydrogenase